MFHTRHLSLITTIAVCALGAGCASSSASRDGPGATAPLFHTSLRSPAVSQTTDATASRSPIQPVVWREGMELQWSVQSPSAPSNRNMGGKAIVGPDGSIELGPYGSVHVAGLTDGQAKTAVVNHLSTYVPDPQVTLIPVTFTARPNHLSSPEYPVSQTAWQAYQPQPEPQETTADPTTPPSAPAHHFGERLLGLWKGS